MRAARSLVIALGFILLVGAASLRAEVGERAVTRAFLTLIAGEEGDMVDAMDLVESTWEPSYLSMALEVVRLSRKPAISASLMQLVANKIGGEHGYDLGAWQRAMWDNVTFTGYDGDWIVQDGSGMTWTMDEHALTAEDGRVLHRIPAQRAFWFGWYAAFPHTRLVQ